MILLNPVSGDDIQLLMARLQAEDPHLNNIDLAFLMNKPLMRISWLKGEQKVTPSQAIITRLLLRNPSYCPLPAIPDSLEVFEAMKPFFPSLGATSKREFSPRFGRSSVTSYKFLDEDPYKVKVQPGLTVNRLYMIVMTQFAKIYKQHMTAYLKEHATQAILDQVINRWPLDWTVLRTAEEDKKLLIKSKSDRAKLEAEIHKDQAEWIGKYMSVLEDEAASRQLPYPEILRTGKWRVKEKFPADLPGKLPPNQIPVTASGMAYSIQVLQSQLSLTSSEVNWMLGLQAKSLHLIRKNEQNYVDPSVAILVRYLCRYPEDYDDIIPPSMNGEQVLQKIQRIDPSFKRSMIGPLFGGGYVSSYEFLKNPQCPYHARRLSSIFAQQIDRNPDFLRDMIECAEEEAFARGVKKEDLWKYGKWSPSK